METAAANDSSVCPVGEGKDIIFTKRLLFEIMVYLEQNISEHA